MDVLAYLQTIRRPSNAEINRAGEVLRSYEKGVSMPRDEFAVHLLNEEGIRKAGLLADLFSRFLDNVEEIVGSQGREMAIVRTKLEEASFFAKKAMAVLPGNQQ